MFVVTGGGSGIGKALAHALVARGKSVLVVGRQEQTLVETAGSFSSIDVLVADVTTQDGRQSIAAHLQHTPIVQGLINNAGIIDPMLPISSLDESAWLKVMATNVDAPLFLTQTLQEKLTHGRVLNIGSGAAYFPVAGWAAYCVSKAALSMLTRCWQLECNTIAFANVMPGIIDTPMQEKIRNAPSMDAEKLDFFRRLKQQNQLLTAETVALFLCWLLLDLDATEYESKEWDIYDASHHNAWIVSPHRVPSLE